MASWIISKDPLLSRVLIWATIQEEFGSYSSNGAPFLPINDAKRLNLMATGANSTNSLIN
jgi:hypothetical protein